MKAPSLSVVAMAGLAILLIGQGCGTVVNGSHQSVAVSTEPPGAHVQVAGGEAATSPCDLRLSRKRNHVVSISLQGYQTEQVTIQSTMSGALAGNLLVGGIVGGGVDLISGGGYKLVPNTIALRLRPGSGMAEPMVPIGIAPAPATSLAPAASAAPTATRHSVDKVLESGRLVVLRDGSVWEVDPMDRVDSSLWLSPDEVTVLELSDGINTHKLLNTDRDQSVDARLLLTR